MTNLLKGVPTFLLQSFDLECMKPWISSLAPQKKKKVEEKKLINCEIYLEIHRTSNKKNGFEENGQTVRLIIRNQLITKQRKLK